MRYRQGLFGLFNNVSSVFILTSFMSVLYMAFNFTLYQSRKQVQGKVRQMAEKAESIGKDKGLNFSQRHLAKHHGNMENERTEFTVVNLINIKISFINFEKYNIVQKLYIYTQTEVET